MVTSLIQQGEKEEESGPLKILVADDDESMRMLVQMTLESEGYTVDSAVDGEEALRKVATGAFHLVVADWKMPKMDGVQLLRAIKEKGYNVEVVLITAMGSNEIAHKAAEEGAFAYLTKPFKPEEMLALIPAAQEKLQFRSVIGIYEAARKIFSNAKGETLVPDLMELGRKILAADEAMLLTLDEDGVLRAHAAAGIPEEEWRRVEVRPGDGLEGRVAEWKMSVLLNDGFENDPRFADLPPRPGVRHLLLYSIVNGNALEGLLVATRKLSPIPFAAIDLRHAMIFCSHMSLAIRNADLEARLETIKRQSLEHIAIKDDMLDTILKDLKAPLGVIHSTADYAMSRHQLSPDLKAQLEKISALARSASRATKELLQIAYLRPAEVWLDKEITPVAPLMESCLSDLSLSILRKGIQVAAENRAGEDCRLQANAGMLREVLTNLIGNAVEYSPEGKAVQVILEKRDGDLVMRVGDEGPGIAPEQQKNLFSKVHVKKIGAGYGMTIAKRFVELHGGTLTLESSPGEGTTFTAVLPGVL